MKAKEKKLLKSLLKKRIAAFNDCFKNYLKKDGKRLCGGFKTSAVRLSEFLRLFQPCFSKRVLETALQTLSDLSEPLEEARIRLVDYDVIRKLIKNESAGEKKKIEPLVRGIEMLFEHASLNITKLLKRRKPGKIGKVIYADFAPKNFGGFSQLMVMLNGKRQALFDQIVRIIRTSQKEDLQDLFVQNEKLCFLLEIVIQAGFRKGKRLLQVLTPLSERLGDICDDGQFREFIQELAVERSRDPERVSDVQLIRALATHLGILEAQAIQDFHSQLPPALQVLKRSLNWPQP